MNVCDSICLVHEEKRRIDNVHWISNSRLKLYALNNGSDSEPLKAFDNSGNPLRRALANVDSSESGRFVLSAWLNEMPHPLRKAPKMIMFYLLLSKLESTELLMILSFF